MFLKANRAQAERDDEDGVVLLSFCNEHAGVQVVLPVDVARALADELLAAASAPAVVKRLR